jgi:hypothetical protein
MMQQQMMQQRRECSTVPQMQMQLKTTQHKGAMKDEGLPSLFIVVVSMDDK